MSVVVVVVVTPVKSGVEDVVTIPTEVETPLNVDAGSSTSGVETVLIELPVGLSTTVTTLVICDVDIFATVPTPETVCLEVDYVHNPPEYSS